MVFNKLRIKGISPDSEREMYELTVKKVYNECPSGYIDPVVLSFLLIEWGEGCEFERDVLPKVKELAKQHFKTVYVKIDWHPDELAESGWAVAALRHLLTLFASLSGFQPDDGILRAAIYQQLYKIKNKKS